MNKIWHDRAWAEYLYWQQRDRKTLKRINSILKDIDRSPFSGIGKPEPLKHERQGYWNRRIDDVHRMVYKVEGDQVVIVQCGTQVVQDASGVLRGGGKPCETRPSC